jgi:magnesium transporter
MRKLAAGATLFAVPTMVAGVYGMNFEHMPELTWRLGYPLVMLVTVVLCGFIFRAFRHNGWL